MLRYVPPISATDAAARAAERVAAGLPTLDGAAPVQADVPAIVKLLLEAFASEATRRR